MNETFFDFASKNFYEVAQKNPEDFGFFISNKIDYPEVVFQPNLGAIIPLPRKQGEKYLFEGIVFQNTDSPRHTMWALFLISVYHLAAHAAVTDYSIYQEWRKNKPQDLCWKIIDFIEDTAVNQYLFSTKPEVCHRIEKIQSFFEERSKLTNRNMPRQIYDVEFYDYVVKANYAKIESLRKAIVQKRNDQDNIKNILLYADILYKHKTILPNQTLPFCEHHDMKETMHTFVLRLEFDSKVSVERTMNESNETWQEDLTKISRTITKQRKHLPDLLFERNIQKLDELWIEEESKIIRMMARYRKHLPDLQFDEIVIPPMNLQEYMKIRARNSLLIKKIRHQISAIANLVDEPKTEEMGLINMQYAIQAIASESKNTDVFEQETSRRHDEAWVMLIDNSTSMKAKFNQIKELVACVSESADVLTGSGGEWAVYGFDNNFSIIKDFKEKFGQDVKARIGGLESGGLSFIPDAIMLATRMLLQDSAERKYVFVFTDGQSSGYEKIDNKLQESIKTAQRLGVNVIGVGLSNNISKYFKTSCSSTELRELVSKFISSYRSLASYQM